MKRIAAIVIITVLSLAGCSSIDHGTITSKTSTPGYTTLVCSAYGKYGCTVWVPVYQPPTYRFGLSLSDETGWVYVTEYTYNSYEVGDVYP